ncbi:MAG: diaminopimelate epimerase [Pseudomonadota bacterium]|nr:diaminopimelate epimerase [Pseudomonadota bacterium]
MHGLGNDFIIFDWRDGGPERIGEAAARRLADRRLGIGCDQILVIRESGTADIRMDILNHDGSPSGACGNGTRCVADHVMRQTGRDDLSIETDGGQLRARFAEGDEIAVDMGPVATGWHAVPLAHEVDTLQVPLEIEGLGDAVCHSLGNPHAVVFVEDAEAVDLTRVGPRVEYAALFPDQVNLSVVSRIDEAAFRMRVWERGVGITMACGSGACAVGVAIVRRGLGPRGNRIVMDGGTVHIDWDEATGHVTMTGPVAYVCQGTLSPELDVLLEESVMEPGHGAS